jgi:hypothetical protein
MTSAAVTVAVRLVRIVDIFPKTIFVESVLGTPFPPSFASNVPELPVARRRYFGDFCGGGRRPGPAIGQTDLSDRPFLELAQALRKLVLAVLFRK